MATGRGCASPPRPACGWSWTCALQRPDAAPLTAAYLDGLLTASTRTPWPGSLRVPARAGPRRPVRALDRTSTSLAGASSHPPGCSARGADRGPVPAPWRVGGGGVAGRTRRGRRSRLPRGRRRAADRVRDPGGRRAPGPGPVAAPRGVAAGRAARFGQRVRARLLRDAAAVIVPSRSAAVDARRLLHVKAAAADRAARPRSRLSGRRPRPSPDRSGSAWGSEQRYAVYAGRFDARRDLPTLLEALGALAGEPVPAGVTADAWPPRCLPRRRVARRPGVHLREPRPGPGC